MLGLLAIAGASGLTVDVAFTSPSALKYALTVAIPMAGILLLNAQRIDLVLVTTAIVFAPFSFLSVGVAGIQFSALDVLLLAAVAAEWLRRPVEQVRTPISAMGVLVSLVLLAFAVPLVNSSDRTTVVHLLVIVLLLSRAVAVASRKYGPAPLVLSFVVAAVVQSILAVVEFIRGSPFNFYSLSGAGGYGSEYFFSYGDVFRSAAAFADPISLGNVLALSVPLIVVAFRQNRALGVRIFLVISGLLVGVGLITTLSRQSWLAAVAGALTATVLLPRKAIFKTLFGLVGVLVAVIFLAIGVAGPDFVTRLQSIGDPTSATVQTASGDEARIQLQRTSLAVGLENQPFGVGLGNLPDYLIARVPNATESVHAHNTYLNIFAEAGVLGLGSIIGVLAGALVLAVRAALSIRDRFAPGVAGAVVSLLVFWATDYTIRYIAVAAMVAVVLGLAAASPSESQRKLEPR